MTTSVAKNGCLSIEFSLFMRSFILNLLRATFSGRILLAFPVFITSKSVIIILRLNNTLTVDSVFVSSERWHVFLPFVLTLCFVHVVVGELG